MTDEEWKRLLALLTPDQRETAIERYCICVAQPDITESQARATALAAGEERK